MPMMNDPQARLQKFIEHVQKQQECSDGDILKIISLTHQLIEHRKEQEKYNILNFYQRCPVKKLHG